MGNSSLKKDAVASLFWKLLERAGSAVVQLLVQLVMARLLAPEEFGALAIMLVFVNLGNIIVQSGLNTSLVQSPDVTDDDYSTVFWMSLTISITLYLLVFASAPLIADFYGINVLVWPLRGLSLILVVNSLNSVQVARVTRELDFKKIFKATVVSVFASAVLGISAAVNGLGLWALVVQQLSYQLVNCLTLHLLINWTPSFVFLTDRAKMHFKFGWRLLASGIIDTLYQSLGDLIIGKQFSSSQLGLVSQGKKYPQAIGGMLDGAIQPVMLSSVAKVQADNDKVKSVVRRALKTSTFLITPAMALFAVVAPALVPLLLGEQWAGSVPFLQAYCVVYAMLPIHTTNLQALNGVGRSDIFLKLEIVKKTYGTIVLLICAFVLKDVKLLVFSYVLTDLVSTLVNAWPNRKIIGYSYWEQLSDILPTTLLTLLASALSSVVARWFYDGVPLILLQVTVFSAVYFGGALICKVEAFCYIWNTFRNLVINKSQRR